MGRGRPLPALYRAFKAPVVKSFSAASPPERFRRCRRSARLSFSDNGDNVRHSFTRSRKFGIASITARNSGCAKMTICSSFSVLVSKLSNTRRISRASGVSFCPSSIRSTSCRFSSRASFSTLPSILSMASAESFPSQSTPKCVQRVFKKLAALSAPPSRRQNTVKSGFSERVFTSLRQSVLFPVPTSPRTTLSPRFKRMAISRRFRHSECVSAA